MYLRSRRGSLAALGAAFPMSPFGLIASTVVPWGSLKIRHGLSVPSPTKTLKVFFLPHFRTNTPKSGFVLSMFITLLHMLCLDVSVHLLPAHPEMFLKVFWGAPAKPHPHRADRKSHYIAS